VFVFPSVTDTFGIVMLEAMACGLPVAAFPVTGPMDVVRDGITGSLNEDLKTAALNALKLNPQDCLDQGQEYTWAKATDQFVKHLTPICS
jgi:glycosyltransferase involved in cell wall biosynthesis